MDGERVDAEVVVVGAGLAGLRCAAELRAAAVDVRVLEREESVGGRVRTDVVEGFRCDRGFQLLNPAYPAVRRHVDLSGLRLRQFAAGALVRREGGLAVVADPRREPRLAGRTLRSGLVSGREGASLARWMSRALRDPQRLLADPDATLRESLDRAGVTGRLRRELLDPFLAGVLADAEGDSSAAFVRLLLRSFVLGTPGVPEAGMQALSDQLARPVADRVSTGVEVEEIRSASHGVEVRGGGRTWRANAVVVAVPGESVSRLTPLPAVATKALTTWWFACDSAPTSHAMLALDGRRRGPVVNAADLTSVAPGYAPPGRRLVQASTLSSPAAATEAEVRSHLSAIYGVPTAGWEVVTCHHIRHALPTQPPSLVARRPVELSERLFVAGDHRDTASLQGALVSGTRAARAVLARMGRSAGQLPGGSRSAPPRFADG